jgi:hypothetical protein
MSFWCLKGVFRQAKGKSAAIFVDKTIVARKGGGLVVAMEAKQ